MMMKKIFNKSLIVIPKSFEFNPQLMHLEKFVQKLKNLILDGKY